MNALTITKHIACPLSESEKRDKHDELVRTLNDLRRIEEHFAGIKEQHKAKYKLPSLHYGKLTANGRQGFLKHFKAAAVAAGFGGKLKNVFNEAA